MHVLTKHTLASEKWNAKQRRAPSDDQTPSYRGFATEIRDPQKRCNVSRDLDRPTEERVPEDVATERARVEREAVIHQVVGDPARRFNVQINAWRILTCTGTCTCISTYTIL